MKTSLASFSRPFEKVLSKGKPEVFNTDQGNEFTSEAFTGLVELDGVRISRDGKGQCRRGTTVEYGEVYLKAYSNGREAKAGLDACLHSYNAQLPNRTLGNLTLAEVFNQSPTPARRAATERGGAPGKASVYHPGAGAPRLRSPPILSKRLGPPKSGPFLTVLTSSRRWG